MLKLAHVIVRGDYDKSISIKNLRMIYKLCTSVTGYLACHAELHTLHKRWYIYMFVSAIPSSLGTAKLVYS